MEPTDALNRAIYLLDRELAPSNKVKAFAKALVTVIDLGRDETRTRAEAGILTELDGIGASTSAVIADAIAEVDDGYLAKLEARSEIPLGVGGDVRAMLKGDCHTHSTWSDGGAPLEVMARTAQSIGHEYLVATDHSARLTIAHGLNEDRLERQLSELEALNADLSPFRVLSGMEVDIFEDGTLDLSDEMLSRLDVVVASVHSKLKLPRADMTRRMATAVANPHVDIPIATGLGDARNAVIACTAEAFVAIGGGLGTLSEIAFALNRNKPVVGLLTWELDANRLEGPWSTARTAAEAVEQIIKP
jgi:putative hydrolase